MTHSAAVLQQTEKFGRLNSVLPLQTDNYGVEGRAMKFFIINSFRLMVYVAYFGIIVIQTVEWYLNRSKVIEVYKGFLGGELNDASAAALAVLWGLVTGWVAATVICGLLVTLLDIRDDINDRLPDGRAK